MKKFSRSLLLIILMVLCLALHVSAAEVVESGECGENATYTLYDDGLLVIAGEGEVDDWVFMERQDFTRVEIRDGITHLGRGLFYRSAVTDAVMADTVTSLGDEYGCDLFAECTKLEHVKLSDNLTKIPAYIFRDCFSLKEIVIPDSVTTIEESAFQGCENITKVKIGNGITTITSYMFSSFVNLTEVVFPENLTVIGDNAFSGTKLEYVVVPNTVTTIGNSAFTGCTKLKEIIIPDSVTSIGEYAFGDCENLSKVTLGKGITTIDSQMFYTNENLTEIILSEGLLTIEDNAFHGSKLKHVVIPDSVTTIGEGAFAYCEDLETFVFGQSVTEVSESMFWGCTNLKDVVLTDSISTIGKSAFYECSSLSKVDIPDSVTCIGEAAFYGCSSLEEVVIPDSVTSLNGNMPWTDVECDRGTLGAFDGCTNLKSITFGKGVEWIPWGFLGSDVLETLIIPEGVKIIDNYAFCFCPSLTYVEIPASVEYIGGFAFVDNFSMTTIVFKGDPPDKMDGMMGICGDYITAAFYPKDVPGWEDAYTGTAAMIPYTLDADGNIIPEAPEESEVLEAMNRFRSGEYFGYTRNLSNGQSYPNIYRYYINGNFHEGKGSEAFAFELSDACFGFLPISDHRDVVYANLQIGDLLYIGDQVWVIGEINAEGVTVHGAENEKIVYGKSLTKAQVEAADSYRTRYSVSPGNGVVNPDTKLEPAPIPEGVPTEAEAYQRIIALQEKYPEGMPWTEKNMYTCNVQALIEEGLATNPAGSACSAFGYLASDTAFGELPARYITYDKQYYDSIMVGDNLLGFNHQMVVLEVYENCLIVAEGNYNGMMHWGRILTREEVEEYYDIFTRYPEETVAPERGYYEIPEKPEETIPMDNPFSDIGEEKEEKPYYYQPVMWAVSRGITTGKTETSFAPNDDCTRAQIVTFIWRAKGEPEPTSTTNPFTDVKTSDYFYQAVLWAVENGITNGLSETTFGPGKGCTRGQVCTFLWRAQGLPVPETGTSPFTDVTGGYYYDAVLWAVENDITNGMGGGKCAPNSICTRGQIVTFLYRAIA